MTSEDFTRRLLVLGATRAIGRELLCRLRDATPPVRVVALTREAPAPLAFDNRVSWRRGDLFHDAIVDPVDTVVSAGPLDGLVAWLERQQPAGIARVVALSSTSLHAKQESPDRRERELAARLRDGERRLSAWCEARGSRWTVLRPTLIYGGADGALLQHARVASTLRFLPLPRSARGLRQPVHAHDVAAALLACLDARACFDRAYDLPGGETLRYDAMVERFLRTIPKPVPVVRVPDALLSAAIAGARLFPRFRGATPAVIARMRQDLIFDGSDAARDFGYAPRAFLSAGSSETSATPLGSSTRSSR